MKKLLQFTLILTAIFSFAIISNAQNQKEISVEKERLIAEIIVLTKADQQIEEITDKMLEGMQKTYPLIVDGVLANNTKLTYSEKEKLKKDMIGKFDSFSKKFRKRLPEAIDYPKYIREVFYPLYDKYFTADELKDIIAFYRTTTGQKVVTTMPKLVEESQEMTQSLLLPQILTLVDKIMKEEIGGPKTSSPPPPPPAPINQD